MFSVFPHTFDNLPGRSHHTGPAQNQNHVQYLQTQSNPKHNATHSHPVRARTATTFPLPTGMNSISRSSSSSLLSASERVWTANLRRASVRFGPSAFFRTQHSCCCWTKPAGRKSRTNPASTDFDSSRASNENSATVIARTTGGPVCVHPVSVPFSYMYLL